MRDPTTLLQPLLDLHARIRDAVVSATERQDVATLSAIDRDDPGDTIYAIDVVGEAIVTPFADALAREHSFALVAEGLSGGRQTYARDGAAEWVIIVDPIDGTRGVMYQKRSAWVLTGVARDRGSETSLRDIVLAVQTEIPLVKQHLSDQLWAVRGQGVQARRHNRLTGESRGIALRPSTATSIAHGYATIARFFPGARDELAAVDEAIVRGAIGLPPPGKAHCFEDQYASTGGQLYELLAGHDRFVADLRPLMRPLLSGRGYPPSLSCHPYDICTALIAQEGGVIVTDPHGQPLDAPLNVEAEVAWAGYANAAVKAQIEPLLQRELARRGLVDERRSVRRQADPPR